VDVNQNMSLFGERVRRRWVGGTTDQEPRLFKIAFHEKILPTANKFNSYFRQIKISPPSGTSSGNGLTCNKTLLRGPAMLFSEINYKNGTNPTPFSTLAWYWYYFCILFVLFE
jgi:hypothetical protein